MALRRYRGLRLEPIEDDPRLVEAAVDAVKQFVFSPGMVSGYPMAVWVSTPVVFRR